MRSIFNQTQFTTTHFRYLWVEDVLNQDSHTTELKSSSSMSRSVHKAKSPGHHDAKTTELKVVPQRNGFLGPIIRLDRDTPIRLHEILIPLTIPSRYKLPNMERWTKKQIAMQFEIRPLLVIRDKKGYVALNHGFLLAKIHSNSNIRPDYFTAREVFIKPSTSDFYELLVTIYVNEFALNRVASGVTMKSYSEAISSQFGNSVRSRRVLERTIGKDQSIDKALARYMGIDQRGVKK